MDQVTQYKDYNFKENKKLLYHATWNSTHNKTD